MTTKSLKPSCFVYDESAYVSDAPLDFPVLINISNTHVDEDTPVTLRCHVTSGCNPPLFWSWYCGDMPMERGLSDGGNWSEVTFIATKMYHQRACYCRLNSTSEKIKYDKRSQKKFITLKSKSSLIIWQLIIFFHVMLWIYLLLAGHICFPLPAFVVTTSLLLLTVVIVSFIVLFRNHRLRERLLAIKMLTCNCFENLCKSPPRRGKNSRFLIYYLFCLFTCVIVNSFLTSSSFWKWYDLISISVDPPQPRIRYDILKTHKWWFELLFIAS